MIENSVLRVAVSENGFLQVAYKKMARQTFEDVRLTIQELRKLVGNHKVCILADVTHIGEVTHDVRYFIAKELYNTTKAIAVFSGSAKGKIMANLFFSLHPQPFPVRIFDNEETAMNWLLKHL